ncbi:MAG: sialate O-acetylesterase, partial [Aeoliella sp.]
NREGDVLDSTAVNDILVGDLWILSGQSNMVGNGRLVDLETPHELVHQLNPRYEWQVAEEPLDSLAESLDEAHWGNAGHLAPLWAKPGQRATGPLEGVDRARFRKNRQHGAGLALTFAKQLVEQTGIPIGLIPCAHGGTSVGQWDPALKHEKQKSLYGAMLARFEAVGGKVKGVLWYQGEADMGEGAAAQYEQKFSDFITSLRTDMVQPDLPFYYVQIGRYVTENPMGWNKIQEVQRQVEQTLPNVGMVVSVDQPIDDIIHVSTTGLKAIGRRLAKRVCHDVYPEASPYRKLNSGPRPNRAYVKVHHGKLDPWSGDRRTLYVEFSGVNGSLQALGRPAGFSVRQPDGAEVVAIFRTEFDPEMPSRVMLELGRGIPNKALPPGTQLWYGWGANPYCNLTDDANLAVPVFGPMEIEGVAPAD